MEPIAAKVRFLQNDYAALLRTIDVNTPPVFGKMNVRQMVEHMTNMIHEAYGMPLRTEVLSPEEHIPKMQAFLRSDKPFRDNTPNVLLPDTPPEPRLQEVSMAITELQKAVDELVKAFAADPAKRVLNPFFGLLDYELTIHLLYKHAWHHLRQFGVPVPETGNYAV